MAEEEIKKIGPKEQARIDKALKKAAESKERALKELELIKKKDPKLYARLLKEDRTKSLLKEVKDSRAEVKVVKTVEKPKETVDAYGASIDTVETSGIEEGVTDIEVLTELAGLSGVNIPENPTEAQVAEVIEQIERTDIVRATKASTFVLNYDIEEIPVPSTGHIYGLTELSRRKHFNKPTIAFSDDTTLDVSLLDHTELPDFNVATKATLKNWISDKANNVVINVGGDPDTVYRLVFRNATTGQYYNWKDQKQDRSKGFDDGFGHGYEVYEGKCSAINEENNIILNIPGTKDEAEYHLYFVPVEGTVYDNGPTEDYPWVLNQLVPITTTIKLLDTGLFGSVGGDVTISHLPGVDLSMQKRNNQIDVLDVSPNKYTIEGLTVGAIRQGELTLNSSLSDEGNLNMQNHINAEGENIYTVTEVLGIDLQASITDENDGIVSGSITLGKMGLRESTVYVVTGSVFTHKVDGKA